MSICVKGQSQVPPGFRFHPTEEELLHYYLWNKVCYHKIDVDFIPDVDLNKLEPWDIQEKCKIGSSSLQNYWYFFSHKDKKYPTGTRTNRATAAGFWKATGRDKAIYGNGKRIGMRKTLVFYKGRAPNGQKSHWIMHEYRLELNHNITSIVSVIEEGWVVCRIFKQKKNHQKSLESPLFAFDDHDDDTAFDQIQQNDSIISSNGKVATPSDDTRGINNTNTGYNYDYVYDDSFSKHSGLENPNPMTKGSSSGDDAFITNWAAFDIGLVASELNDPIEASRNPAYISTVEPTISATQENYTSEIDHIINVWNFAP